MTDPMWTPIGLRRIRRPTDDQRCVAGGVDDVMGRASGPGLLEDFDVRVLLPPGAQHLGQRGGLLSAERAGRGRSRAEGSSRARPSARYRGGRPPRRRKRAPCRLCGWCRGRAPRAGTRSRRTGCPRDPPRARRLPALRPAPGLRGSPCPRSPPCPRIPRGIPRSRSARASRGPAPRRPSPPRPKHPPACRESAPCPPCTPGWRRRSPSAVSRGMRSLQCACVSAPRSGFCAMGSGRGAQTCTSRSGSPRRFASRTAHSAAARLSDEPSRPRVTLPMPSAPSQGPENR